MYKAPHIRLLVADFPSCFRFYRDTMGLTPGYGSEEDVYADFEIDGRTLALFQRSLMAEAVGATGKVASSDAQDTIMLILATEDVDAAANNLQAAGVTLAAEPQDRKEWGIRTAHFRDPDGNLIEINQSL
jgi:catechol 2,3-dioxygenase-like lactoylglutathione lyase family enzyme